MGWRCAACGPVTGSVEGTYRGQGCPGCGAPLSLEPEGDPLGFACPWCAALVSADARRCPGCQRALDARCEALVPSCPACGVALVARALGERGVHACEVCGGLLVDADALEAWVADRAVRAPEELRAEVEFQGSLEVRYRRCPRCGAVMNRVNFGPGSGVITDVCARHGVWLDQGELGQILAFARRGGVEAAERRRLEAARARGKARGGPWTPGAERGDEGTGTRSGSVLVDLVVALLRTRA